MQPINENNLNVLKFKVKNIRTEFDKNWSKSVFFLKKKNNNS